MATNITSKRMIRLGMQSSSRTFMTSAPRCSRRQVVVELLDDVNGLGQMYDRMTMNPGRARNELIPNGLARIVPWKRNVDQSPVVATEKVLKRDQKIRAQKQSLITPDGGVLGTANIDAAALSTPPHVLNLLYELPPSFSFARRTISAASDSIHGSLTLTDIATRLQEECGLSNLDVDVAWRDVRLEENARIRALGSYDAVVRVRGMGQEEAPLSIEITPLHE